MSDKPELGSVFLETRGIHKRFGGVHALRGVSITIKRGEIYHLLGENGCGKSTLIKIISGAQPPDEGCLVIDGTSYQALTPIESLALGVETVYQDLSLIPNLTVAENVALSEQLVRSNGRLAKVLDRTALRETSRRALSAVNLAITDSFLDTVVSELPLAVRQLIAIARAIATQARLVIMDEPTTSLTRMEVENLIRVVNELRKDGVAVLFVTHKLDERYAIGSVVEGRVRKLSEFGAFIEIEEGIDGLVHISDLSWTKRIQHPSELLKKGQVVQAVILNIDSGNRRLSLGVKQLQPDAWETFFQAHQVGSIVKGKPSRAVNFGIFVELAPGVEGLCHNSELPAELRDKVPPLPLGEELSFKVLKMTEAEKRIGLSLVSSDAAEERQRLEDYQRQANETTQRMEEVLQPEQAAADQVSETEAAPEQDRTTEQ